MENMQNISQKSMQDFCRTCLQELEQLKKFNIHCLDLEIRQWLQDDTLENCIAIDTFPSNICHLCRIKLEELLEFRKMCARSRKRIMVILKENLTKRTLEIKLDINKENDVLDKNQDWLEFDFVVPNKTETTICNKEFDIEMPLKSNTCHPGDTKEDTEQVKYLNNFNHKVESKGKEENEESSEKDHERSGREYDIKENYEKETSDSDSNSGKEINEVSIKECTYNKKQAVEKFKTKKPMDTIKTYNYKCNQCDRRCLNEQTLHNHIRTHQGLKPYQCPKCNRSYNKSTHLREHLKEVHAEEKLNIICEYDGCGKQFQRNESYKSHYRLKHVTQRQQVDQAQLQHICEDCGKTYKNLASLKKHQFAHKPKDQYPFQCNICDKAFTTQYAFDEHQLRHAGVKNFECPYCGMKKTTKHELHTHINYHTKEKQWYCSRCPMVFNSSGNLRLHDQIIHQGIRRWNCRFCEESFGKKDALKHHEMRHTGEKPHVCTECGKSFIQKYALKTHMKTHNKYLAKHQSEHSI